jgi:hypothetical protein
LSVILDITSEGFSGSHFFRKTNVNTNDNYIYFKQDGPPFPEEIIEGKGYVYRSGVGSLLGVAEESLLFASFQTPELLAFEDINDNPVNISGLINGNILFNNPVLINSVLNINMPTPNNQAVTYLTNETPLLGLDVGETYFLKNVPATFIGTESLYSLDNQTHTFTTCGQTGRVGPNQSQILSSYSVPWAGQFLTEIGRAHV